MAAILRTVTTVFAQSVASAANTTIQTDITTLLADIDAAVPAHLSDFERCVIHDNLLEFAEKIATAMH